MPSVPSNTDSATVLSIPTIRTLKQISMSDIQNKQDAYKNVVKTANEFRKAMQVVSKFATQFGDGLTQFAQLCEQTAAMNEESIASIYKYADMQYTFASGNNTLCELFESQFESPLNYNYQNHKLNVQHNTTQYKKAKEQHTHLLKVLDKEQVKAQQTHHLRDTTHVQFQDRIRDMTRQATGLEKIKNHHFDKVVGEEVRNAQFMADRCKNWVALEHQVLWGQLSSTVGNNVPPPLIMQNSIGADVAFKPLADQDLFLNFG